MPKSKQDSSVARSLRQFINRLIDERDWAWEALDRDRQDPREPLWDGPAIPLSVHVGELLSRLFPSLGKGPEAQAFEAAIVEAGANNTLAFMSPLLTEAHEAHREFLFAVCGDRDPDANRHGQAISRLIEYLPALETWPDDKVALQRMAHAILRMETGGRQATNAGSRPKPKSGRPKKAAAPDAGTLLESALTKHHGYETGGSVSNPAPATLGILAGLSGLSKPTVATFLEKRFGKPWKERYKAACLGGILGVKIVPLCPIAIALNSALVL